MHTPALTILTLLATQTFGQQNMVGISAGVGIGRLHGRTIMHPSDPTIAFQSSNYYNRWSASGVGFQTQLTVATMGGARNEYLPKSGGFNGPAYQYNFTHLGLSLGAAYRTSRRFHGVVSFGVLPSFIVSASSLSRSYYPVPNKEISTGIGSEVNRFIIFGYGTVGAGYHFKGPVTIGLFARYDRGLSPLSTYNFFQSQNIKEACWTVSANVAYRWSRKQNATLQNGTKDH